MLGELKWWNKWLLFCQCSATISQTSFLKDSSLQMESASPRKTKINLGPGWWHCKQLCPHSCICNPVISGLFQAHSQDPKHTEQGCQIWAAYTVIPNPSFQFLRMSHLYNASWKSIIHCGSPTAADKYREMTGPMPFAPIPKNNNDTRGPWKQKCVDWCRSYNPNNSQKK